ncbi:MAG TPA: DivIVA domain-containing protein [Halanaerobiales bacterium]|nr:DivIVA domain-containing protein [Halanaerobiales bacterium]
MNLSPLDIYNKEFKSSALGYNKKEVEEFLEDVGMSYEKALKKVNALQEENEKLEKELKRYEKLDQKLQNTLQAIQDTVTEEKERARKEAELIISKAEDQAEKIKKNARDNINDEYKKLEKLKEKKKLFEIRFRTLLENHMELLNEEKTETDINKEQFDQIKNKDFAEDEDHIESEDIQENIKVNNSSNS